MWLLIFLRSVTGNKILINNHFHQLLFLFFFVVLLYINVSSTNCITYQYDIYLLTQIHYHERFSTCECWPRCVCSSFTGSLSNTPALETELVFSISSCLHPLRSKYSILITSVFWSAEFLRNSLLMYSLKLGWFFVIRKNCLYRLSTCSWILLCLVMVSSWWMSYCDLTTIWKCFTILCCNKQEISDQNYFS